MFILSAVAFTVNYSFDIAKDRFLPMCCCSKIIFEYKRIAAVLKQFALIIASYKNNTHFRWVRFLPHHMAFLIRC